MIFRSKVIRVWSGLWPDARNENAPITSTSESDLVLVIDALSFQLRAKRATRE